MVAKGTPGECPLFLWKDDEDRFPRLSKVGRTVLGIPANSKPSERVFSVAGAIRDVRRSSLRPEST